MHQTWPGWDVTKVHVSAKLCTTQKFMVLRIQDSLSTHANVLYLPYNLTDQSINRRVIYRNTIIRNLPAIGTCTLHIWVIEGITLLVGIDCSSCHSSPTQVNTRLASHDISMGYTCLNGMLFVKFHSQLSRTCSGYYVCYDYTMIY